MRRAPSLFKSPAVSRRNFLSAFASAATQLIPAPLAGKGLGLLTGVAVGSPHPAPAFGPDYRLTPHYPASSPLDELIHKALAGEDSFPSEKHAREIETILRGWGAALRQAPPNPGAIKDFVAPALAAATPRPAAMKGIREDTLLSVWRVSFPSDPTLSREAFLQEMKDSLAPISEFTTAEFKVAGLGITSTNPLRINTRIRYVLVGAGARIHREQRVGTWQIEWERSPAGEFQAQSWKSLEETRSRTNHPVFLDVTAQSLAGTASYTQQMLRGTDYWRTVLDAATGIDVYGNNGIAAGDFDNDGYDDLYVCQASGLPNRLYRNRGDGTFDDVTEAAGVGVLDNTPCALFADVDNDGLQDLLVVTANGPLLFQNQGDGTFHFSPDAFHFAQPPQGTFTGAAFGDYDRDGRLDVYFCLYSYYRGLDQYQFPAPYYDAQNGPPNFLFRNNGGGTFSDVTARSGLDRNNNRYSFDCDWCDFDNDGWPDLYVVNDFGRKNLYHNNGDGTFTDIAEEAGVLDIGPGMSACWFDYDNDGLQDLYVSDMWEASGMRLTEQEDFQRGALPSVRALFRRHAKGNSLFHNRGNRQFEDKSASAGVEKAGWSWSSYAWDFDCDGFADLYVANGMISGPNKNDLESFFWQHVVSQSPVDQRGSRSYEQGWNAINELIRADSTWAGYQRNAFFANNRDGTFSDVSGAVGLDFRDDSRAFALADLDHDGRLELVLKNRTGPQLRVLRCENDGLGDSVALRLRGRKSNCDAIGAVVTIQTAQGRQTKLLQAGTGFPSQHTKEVFFGFPKSGAPVRAEVHWPSGLVQRFENIPVNHRVAIEEGVERFQATPFRARPAAVDAPKLQEAIPPPAACETWLIDPVRAPDFELPGLDGRVRKLGDLRGRPALVGFWATWSPLSRGELTKLDLLHTKADGEGLQIIAISVDDPGEARQVRSVVESAGVALPVVLASEDVAGIYNLVYHLLFDRRRNLGIPTSFLIDEKGYIVKVYQGPLDPEHLREDLRHAPTTREERVKKALPFSGKYYAGDFRRNNFTWGVAFYQAGYLDQAAASFELALESNPDYAEAHYNLGTLYMKKRLVDEAGKHLARAVELRPNYPDALNNLGLLAAEGGRAEEAIGYFQKAVRLDPGYSIALLNLGNLYRRQRRFPEAEQAFQEALQVNPEDAEASYGMGMLFAQQNNGPRAEEYLRKALQLRPDYPEALNNLGVLYLLLGRSSEGESKLRDCIRVAPPFDQPYLNLARLYVTRGEKEKAAEVLRQLLGQQPHHAAAQNMLEQLSH